MANIFGLLHCLFPAGAGVIPNLGIPACASLPVPRRGGGDPKAITMHAKGRGCSPQGRG